MNKCLYTALVSLTILTSAFAETGGVDPANDILKYEDMNWSDYVYYSWNPSKLCNINFGDNCIQCTQSECEYRNSYLDDKGKTIPCAQAFPGCLACIESQCQACHKGGYHSGYALVAGKCLDCRHFGYDCLTCNEHRCTRTIADDYEDF